jgi:ubiquinone/menaquinone biosynthesis C-methylase UbiE
MEPLTHFFIDKKIDTVLDVGTGKGAFIQVLQNIFSDAEITGVDPDLESLAIAQEAFPGLTFNQMNAENLQFENNSFDLVSISMALHHLRKINRGLLEMKRVTKPGGYIIINELISDNLNPAQEVHKLYHHFRSKIDRLTGISHRETFSKNAILQMLKTADIPVQFFFEHTDTDELITDKTELLSRVQKMEDALERIKDREEYTTMKPLISEFREQAMKFGFQLATRVVIVGRVK